MRKLLIITIGVLLLSCNNRVKRYPGISLSFDDRSINEWFELRELFNENNVRVTFFITQPDSLDSQEIHKLRLLENDGHEIGFHGNMHELSEYYIKENSYSDYLKNEIDEGMRKMDSLGFDCVSFAYPYGAKYWFTDFLLLKQFKFLRGVAPLNKEKDISKIDEVYYKFDDDRTLSAIGFDKISEVTPGMINTALERSIENQEILLMYAHSPSISNQDHDYTFNIDLLKSIIQLANQKNIGFYPIGKMKFNNSSHLRSFPERVH
ncbi:polysaccharide deacetylase family protein [Fulvivirga sp.]|uniref:polysaccharide deacetylase family protein n=1 Tax=Fulvivirga sp. TaxID=1931237 RepID=UPI0032EC0045